MNKSVDDVIYESGLIAQGCWDELDSYAKDSIIRAIQLTAKGCAEICMSQADRKNIRHKFGLPVESNVKYPGPEADNSINSQYNRQINLPKGVIK